MGRVTRLSFQEMHIFRVKHGQLESAAERWSEEIGGRLRGTDPDRQMAPSEFRGPVPMRPLSIAVLIAGVLLAGPAGGGGPTPVPTLDSGLYGRITKGPVIRATSPPIAATVVVTRCGGRSRITSFRSDSLGRYRIALPPGHYCFEGPPTNDAPYPFHVNDRGRCECPSIHRGQPLLRHGDSVRNRVLRLTPPK
jgi:hypothetical protein